MAQQVRHSHDRPFWHRTRAVLADALGHFNDDDGWAMSSHVSLSALMAVFPFLIFVAALAGFVGEEGLATRVADILFATWPEEVAGPIAAQVRQVLTQSHGGLLTISALVALFLASNGVEAARTALNRAYRVTERRSFLFLRFQSFIFVLAGAIASLVLAFLGVLGPLILRWLESRIPALQPFAVGLNLASVAVTAIVLVAILVASHLWLPAGRPPVRALWPGIVLTLALWVLSAIVFGVYLERFSNMAATYAGLASVVTAIFFLYLIAVIMIFGAEFNASLARLREGKL